MRESIPWMFSQPLALRCTLRRWRSMLGSILGVSVALAMVLTILAVDAGMKWLHTGDFVVSGVDLYLVRRGGALVPLVPGETVGFIDDARQVMARVRSLPEVRTALGVGIASVDRTPDGPRYRLPVERIVAMGVDGDAELIANALDIRQGRWFRRSDEVVLGYQLAQARDPHVGDTLLLSQRRLTVVGIGHLRGVGENADGSAYLAWDTLRGLSDAGDRVNDIMVDATDPPAASLAVSSSVRSIDVWDRQRVLAATDVLIARANVVWQLVSGLALFIAGVFVSSVLLRSISERRQEFATLRAIGVGGRTLVMMVLSDALLVTLGSCALAVGVTQLLGAALNAMASKSADLAESYRFDPLMFVYVLGVAVGVGALASLLPVRSILGVQPAAALQEA